MEQKDEQAIRQRAYELWLAASKPECSHLRFWKEAEEQWMLERQREPTNEASDQQ